MTFSKSARAKKVSIGTTVELAWAYASRKPVIVCMKATGNPHDSLHVRGLATYLVQDLDSAIAVARCFFNSPIMDANVDLSTGGEAKALAKAIALLPMLIDGKPAGDAPMSTEGREYMRQWVSDNLPWLAQRPNMDVAAMALQARLSAGQRGLDLDDLAPLTVESIIAEAMEGNVVR
jgi:hypothetical protein